MEMALGRQRVVVFTVLDRAERPVNTGELERAYARQKMRRQLERERFVHETLAWKSMAWWNGMY